MLSLVACLAAEALGVSYLIQQTPIEEVTGPALALRHVDHWMFRFLIAFAVSLVMLMHLKRTAAAPPDSEETMNLPERGGQPMRWLVLHALLLVPFLALSETLYRGSSDVPFPLLATAWHALGLGAVLALFRAVKPLHFWRPWLERTGWLPLYAGLTAAAAVLVIPASQRLWEPTARITFGLVVHVLRPVLPGLQEDGPTLTISTDRFALSISEVCSGLEGVGLILVFCAAWLGYFRRDYRFPRVLLIVPLAVVLVFACNVLRIAAMVLIGDAGYPDIATVGFHSQAGWFAFNLVALGVAVLAKHSAWLSAGAIAVPQAASANPVAPYLMPLLAILAAGMLTHALSAGFETLYPLRFAAALAMLWTYRRTYATLEWRCSWRAVVVGLLVAAVWCAGARLVLAPATIPPGLAALPEPGRQAWLALRALAAVTTVPLAEELAFRGYLLRRLTATDFQVVRWRSIGWVPLAGSSLIFGATHGALWLPATLAGAAYGWLARSRGSLGEATLAHAVSNASIVVTVLLAGRWELW